MTYADSPKWARVPVEDRETYRMRLGVHSGWSRWAPRDAPREHAPYYYEQQGLYVRKPYERLFERIGIRNRWAPGPKPFKPGRYTTARWQPYSGSGRFSGIAESARGGYYAARYTGVHLTPDHYILEHDGPEAYERHIAYYRYKQSWRMDIPRADDPIFF